jgi:uncharacterized membrane protein YGL010W
MINFFFIRGKETILRGNSTFAAMRKIEDLLNEYGESHQNPLNKIIHWVCVPVIFYCTIGLIWLLPVPDAFKEFSFPINWATIGMVLVFIYYSQLSRKLSYGMIFIFSGIIGLQYQLMKIYGTNLWLPLVILFVIAWIGQFIGHKIEGKKPSFFHDILFLLIGPLWILNAIFEFFKRKF